MLVQGEAEAGDFSAGDFAGAFSRQVKTGLASLNMRERRISPTTPRSTMPPTAAPMATPATSPSERVESDDSCCNSVAIMVGSDSTVIPSAAEAVAAVPSFEESKVCTDAAVVPAGTLMVAVMITLAAATLIVTSDMETPAARAICSCKLKGSIYILVAFQQACFRE